MPQSRLAALALRASFTLALYNTRAGGLQLSSVLLFRSTFDLILPDIPTFLASQICKSSRDEGKLDVYGVVCCFGPG